MARHVDDGGRSHRSLTQSEALERLRKARDRMLGIAQELEDSEWAGMMVPHKFMGPLPAAFYPLFQLVDYGLHSWDIREGTGQGHVLDGDTADLWCRSRSSSGCRRRRFRPTPSRTPSGSRSQAAATPAATGCR